MLRIPIILRKPIILLTCASDLPGRHLRKAVEEITAIKRIIEKSAAASCYKVLFHPEAKPEEIIECFESHKGRIKIFHYAGHSDGAKLYLNTDAGAILVVDALAEMLQGISALKFVFINGCQAVGQVSAWQKLGVSSLILTHFPVNDEDAFDFAITFWKEFTKKPLRRVSHSFEYARKKYAALKGFSGDIRTREIRDLYDPGHISTSSFPWVYHITEEGDSYRLWSRCAYIKWGILAAILLISLSIYRPDSQPDILITQVDNQAFSIPVSVGEHYSLQYTLSPEPASTPAYVSVYGRAANQPNKAWFSYKQQRVNKNKETILSLPMHEDTLEVFLVLAKTKLPHKIFPATAAIFRMDAIYDTSQHIQLIKARIEITHLNGDSLISRDHSPFLVEDFPLLSGVAKHLEGASLTILGSQGTTDQGQRRIGKAIVRHNRWQAKIQLRMPCEQPAIRKVWLERENKGSIRSDHMFVQAAAPSLSLTSINGQAINPENPIQLQRNRPFVIQGTLTSFAHMEDVYIRYQLFNRRGVALGLFGGERSARIQQQEPDGKWSWEQSLSIQNNLAKSAHFYVFFACAPPLESDIQNYYGTPTICEIKN